MNVDGIPAKVSTEDFVAWLAAIGITNPGDLVQMTVTRRVITAEVYARRETPDGRMVRFIDDGEHEVARHRVAIWIDYPPITPAEAAHPFPAASGCDPETPSMGGLISRPT